MRHTVYSGVDSFRLLQSHMTLAAVETIIEALTDCGLVHATE